MRFSRQLTLQFMFWVALIWIGLSGLIYSASLVEGMALKQASLGMKVLAWSSFLKTVEFSWLLLPATGLLSALITGTIAARRGELTGFYSCGGRPSTIVRAWSIASLAWIALGIGLAEYILPVAKQEQLGLDLGVEKTQRLAAERRPVEWVSIEDWRIFLPTVSAHGSEFIEPQVLEMKSGKLLYVWSARRLAFENEEWILREAIRFSMNGGRKEFEERRLDLSISPRDLWMIAAPPALLSRSVLQELIEQRRRVGTDYVEHEVSLARRLGYPIAFLPLLLIVAPFSLGVRRTRSFAESIGLGAIVVGVAFGVEGIFRMLALGRQLNPAWGGWGLALCAGVVWLLSVVYRKFNQPSA